QAIRACAPLPTPDFALSSTPLTRTISPGDSTTYTISVTPSGGFNGAVNLAVSGLPDLATATFDPNPMLESEASTLTITTEGTVVPATYTLTINRDERKPGTYGPQWNWWSQRRSPRNRMQSIQRNHKLLPFARPVATGYLCLFFPLSVVINRTERRQFL